MSIEQALHCKIVGQGPTLVLVHGWGVNSLVWEPVIETLSEYFCLYIVDLPGFGESAGLDSYSLKSVSEKILQVVPKNATWCGWSLGGLIATYAALNYPHRVTGLIQVASSIKFVADSNWDGVEPSVFDDFKQGLQINPQKTLARFIALQAMGCVSARKDGSTIKKLLIGCKPALHDALASGLNLLSESDLRGDFVTLKQPCAVFLGRFDSLVPVRVSDEMATLIPQLQVQIFENSSHAPFISESDLFCKKIVDFMAD